MGTWCFFEISVDKDHHTVSKKNGWKHCLIMDEVDGMAGNEDRGGVQVSRLLTIEHCDFSKFSVSVCLYCEFSYQARSFFN